MASNLQGCPSSPTPLALSAKYFTVWAQSSCAWSPCPVTKYKNLSTARRVHSVALKNSGCGTSSQGCGCLLRPFYQICSGANLPRKAVNQRQSSTKRHGLQARALCHKAVDPTCAMVFEYSSTRLLLHSNLFLMVMAVLLAIFPTHTL